MKHLDRFVCLDFFKAVRAFDPIQMKGFIAADKQDFAQYGPYLNLPETLIVLEEWQLYLDECRRGDLPQPENGFVGTALSLWWESKKDVFPTLSKFAHYYIWQIISSAEVERSFSAYTNIFTDKRQSLTPENISDFLFVLFNK